MKPFYFFHSLKELQIPEPQDQNSVIWETCLRKIIFAEDLHYGKNIFELYEDEAALVFLIEVLCGLQSKVIGETEIFGQFKQFIGSKNSKNISFFQNPQFVQFLLKQVKEIREKHINGLGVSSYGSLIRKLCQDKDEVSLIGYGQLAKKILPWINQHKVKIHVRDKSKHTITLNHEILNLSEMKFNSTVIIAAPIQADILFEIFKSTEKLNRIIDCRSLDLQNQTIKTKVRLIPTEVFELQDLFASIEAKQDKIRLLLPVIKQEIQERVQAYLLKVQHRPQGWEDLCG